MRIISGEYGGRIIKIPKSKLIRPTTEKNKEAIFNYLNNKIDFENIKVCDLYAGSGSLGLEALSRGASEVNFVEKNFQIYQNLLKNISSLKAEERTRAFKMSCLKFSNQSEHSCFDLILADPPFFKNDIYQVFENLKEKKYLVDDGLLIIERSVQTEKDDVINFGLEPIKKLGDSLIYEFKFS